jgi:D-alanine-D-alanine ligase
MTESAHPTLKPRVVVLAGGPDAEREVSLASGQAISDALRAGSQFEVEHMIIDRLDVAELAALDADVVFPALHGPWGEGGALQELLESAGRPFVGAGSESARLCMDKLRSKEAAKLAGIATPDAVELRTPLPETWPIDPPVVLKPIDDGSSVDVRICDSIDQARIDAADLLSRRSRVMAETYIPGRELTVGIVEPNVVSLIEIQPSVGFYDFEAKYEREDTGYVVEPELSTAVADAARANALLLFKSVGCRDLGRVDYRLDDNDQLWFLEINTIPGFTAHSLVPLGAAAAGINMTGLCEQLVSLALSRAK